MTWLLVLPVATTLLANVPAGAAELTIEPTIEPGVSEPSTPATAVAPQEPAARWYGAPALAVDGAVTVGVTALVYMTDNDRHGGTPPMLYGLAAAYLLAGPVVHLVHGHGLRSAESLLVRVGALAAGLAATYALAGPAGCEVEVSESGPCRAPYALALAPLTAMVVDDLFLAREPAAQPSKTSLSARVLAQPGLALLGIGGTF